MKGTSEAARLRLASVAAEYVESLGRGMRFQREQLGLSRSEVARKLPGKTNENAIYRWEGGQHKPSDATLEALAEVLGVGHWTRFMDLDPQRAASKPQDTPDPFPSPADPLAARLDAIEAAIADARRERDEHAQRVEGLLRNQDALLERQSAILDRIEASLAAERAATGDVEAARQRLLDSAEAASRVYADAARRLEAARGTQAK